ncbi:MAG TPA: serine hydrolase domain-containing protein, partial [Candidatus Baltobacteraceae bacterium]|nr:serine hydrolase domain-containing protein [Candidatus Baltobacteraceae bacterium]
MIRTIAAAAALLCLLGAAPLTLTPNQIAAINAIGNRSVAGRAAPGLTIAILSRGSVVYAKGFGYMNVEDSVPARGDTSYPIGSNTKQFTAAAILMLQDEGKLNVDDRLAKYLPEIPHASQVTLRNLLTHPAGYAEYTEIGSFDELGNRPATLAEIVNTVDHRPLAFTPGTTREYSNTGYDLLAMVIERVSGMSYGDFLEQRIFKPLGMTATFVRSWDDTRPNVATEYESYALGPWEHAEHLDYTWFGGAGSIVSNGHDLAKWNAALAGGKLLSKHSLTEMMTPHSIGKNDPFPDYGFGIEVSRLPNGHMMVSHGGNTYGAATQDARFPDDHLGIVVLANSGAFSYNSTVSALYRVLVPSAAVKPSAHPASTPGKAAKPQASPAMIAAAESWLNDAVAGNVDISKLRPDFRAHMIPSHRAALQALSALGKRSYTLITTDRRPPTTAYLFMVKTPKKTLIYAYSRDDD